MRLLFAALLFLVGILKVVTIGADGATSSLSWAYDGALGPSWWTDAYATCATSSQSPIDLVTSSATSPVQAINIRRSTNIVQVNAMLSLVTSNTIRADVWFGDVVVYLLWNGEAAVDSRRYVLHHVAVHFASEHTYSGQAAVGEVTYTFFPYVSDESKGKLRDGAVSFSFPFNRRSSGEDRLDYMLQRLATGHKLNAGVGSIPFSFPAQSSAVVYSGTMTFPPCYAATVVVSSTPITLHDDTVDALVSVLASAGAVTTARPVQPLNGRSLQLASITQTGFVASLPTLADLQALAPELIIDSTSRSYDNEVYQAGAAMAASVVGVLCAALLGLGMERRSFVSNYRDVWRNSVTGKDVFGCAQPDDPVDDEPQNGGDDEEGEEAEEEDEDEEDDS